MKIDRDTIAHLEARSVKMPESEGGCWLWTMYRDQKGYGKLTRRGCSPYVHRAAMVAHGYDVDGLSVDHRCINPGCWNPAHLELVTLAENTRRAANRRWGVYRRLTELTGVGDFRGVL